MEAILGCDLPCASLPPVASAFNCWGIVDAISLWLLVVVLGSDLPRASSSGSFLFLLLGDCGYNFLAVWWLVLALTHYCWGIVDTISLRGWCLH